VYDIVKFVTTQSILDYLLQFDADSLFKILRPFYVETEPFQFMESQDDFLMMYQEEFGLERCQSLSEIIKTLNDSVEALDNEDVKTAFAFFIASIARKAAWIVPEEMCLKTIKEHLLLHRRLVSLSLPLPKGINN